MYAHLQSSWYLCPLTPTAPTTGPLPHRALCIIQYIRKKILFWCKNQQQTEKCLCIGHAWWSSLVSVLSVFFMETRTGKTRGPIKRALLHIPWWLLLRTSAEVRPRYSVWVQRHWASRVCNVSLRSAGGGGEVTEVYFSSLAGRPHMSSFCHSSRRRSTVTSPDPWTSRSSVRPYTLLWRRAGLWCG